jgi:hypothetical protein
VGRQPKLAPPLTSRICRVLVEIYAGAENAPSKPVCGVMRAPIASRLLFVPTSRTLM